MGVSDIKQPTIGTWFWKAIVMRKWLMFRTRTMKTKVVLMITMKATLRLGRNGEMMRS